MRSISRLWNLEPVLGAGAECGMREREDLGLTAAVNEESLVV
jgi:hypothetical protein